MIQWQHFPKSIDAPKLLKDIIKCFEEIETEIDSETHQHRSNEVVKLIRPYLEELGFRVETGKKANQRISVPVLFGMDGKPEKSFYADAYHEESRTVLEIEAGRARTNYQFLKDLFETCMMYNVDFLVIAIRRIYRKSKDFDKIVRFFETLYASRRLTLPLKGILVIGY